FRARVAGAGRDVRSAMRRPCAAAPGRAKHGAPIRVSLTWLMLAALVAAAGLPERAHADAALLAGASPRARKVRLRVGERQRFAAPAVGGEARCTWRLDDQTVPGMALTWDFVPTPAHMGAHRVTLRLDGSAGFAERWWAVRVEPPRPPTAPVPTTTTVPVLPVYPTTTLAARPSPPQPAPTSRPAPPRATTTTLPTVARATPPTTVARAVPIAPPRTLPPRVASVPP